MPTFDFLYVEAVGPFQETAPKAWQDFWMVFGRDCKKEDVDKMMALSNVDFSKEGNDRFVYQAGVSLRTVPDHVFEPLKHRTVPGAKFARFTLRGSYSQFGQAYPKALSLLGEQHIARRDGFCLEVYLNTPNNTKEEDLLTEIYIPI